MQQLPEAVYDDGMLDLSLVRCARCISGTCCSVPLPVQQRHLPHPAYPAQGAGATSASVVARNLGRGWTANCWAKLARIFRFYTRQSASSWTEFYDRQERGSVRARGK